MTVVQNAVYEVRW